MNNLHLCTYRTALNNFPSQKISKNFKEKRKINNSIKFETQTRFRNRSNGRNQDRVSNEEEKGEGEKSNAHNEYLFCSCKKGLENCLQNKGISGVFEIII
jgi:hypothetical protein